MVLGCYDEFPVVDRQCLVLARQCRRKKKKALSCCSGFEGSSTCWSWSLPGGPPACTGGLLLRPGLGGLDLFSSSAFLSGPKAVAPLRTLLRPHAINPRYGVVKTKRKKQNLPKGGNKTTSEDENLLEHCAKTMHVTCVAMSRQAGARKATSTYAQHGSCFCKHKNSLRPQANNSLSWS